VPYRAIGVNDQDVFASWQPEYPDQDIKNGTIQDEQRKTDYDHGKKYEQQHANEGGSSEPARN
jgi:hypothetical protein